MLSVILLVLAISIDAFAVSVTYGIRHIRIPFVSALIISFVGTFFLFISLSFANLITKYISDQVCVSLSIILLVLIAFASLFESTIKAYLKAHKGQKNVSFSLSEISFAIDIFLDETKADKDNSKSLSPKEAVLLAVALSVDSLASGFSAGLTNGYFALQLILCFIATIIFCLGGRKLGERISDRSSVDISWVSGILLLCLAMIKLIQYC